MLYWVNFALSLRQLNWGLSGAHMRCNCRGEVAEWLKAHAWKACLLEMATWVRIPPSPPILAIQFQLLSNPEFFVYLLCPLPCSRLRKSILHRCEKRS